MKCLSLCHSIICEDDEQNKGDKIFNSPSPDEIALANFAKYSYYEYRGMDRHNNMLLKVPNGKGGYRIDEYPQEEILGFSSKRKRMSVILKTPDDRIVLYCKGADSIVLPRCQESVYRLQT